MRGAGCVINDYADRHFDGYVKRTCMRPLVSGKLTEKEALSLFAGLMLVSFILVLLTNPLTIGLSFVALGLAVIYPFMKRHTHLPQVVLGAAFGWSIPMAWAAQTGELTTVTWLLFTANLLWTIAYDTQYAMMDRNDDLKIGVKSTAILFGELNTLINAVLQVLALVGLILVGVTLSLGWFFYLGLLGGDRIVCVSISTDADKGRLLQSIPQQSVGWSCRFYRHFRSLSHREVKA